MLCFCSSLLIWLLGVGKCEVQMRIDEGVAPGLGYAAGLLLRC